MQMVGAAGCVARVAGVGQKISGRDDLRVRDGNRTLDEMQISADLDGRVFDHDVTCRIARARVAIVPRFDHWASCRRVNRFAIGCRLRQPGQDEVPGERGRSTVAYGRIIPALDDFPRFTDRKWQPHDRLLKRRWQQDGIGRVVPILGDDFDVGRKTGKLCTGRDGEKGHRPRQRGRQAPPSGVVASNV